MQSESEVHSCRLILALDGIGFNRIANCLFSWVCIPMLSLLLRSYRLSTESRITLSALQYITTTFLIIHHTDCQNWIFPAKFGSPQVIISVAVDNEWEEQFPTGNCIVWRSGFYNKSRMVRTFDGKWDQVQSFGESIGLSPKVVNF